MLATTVRPTADAPGRSGKGVERGDLTEHLTRLLRPQHEFPARRQRHEDSDLAADAEVHLARPVALEEQDLAGEQGPPPAVRDDDIRQRGPCADGAQCRSSMLLRPSCPLRDQCHRRRGPDRSRCVWADGESTGWSAVDGRSTPARRRHRGVGAGWLPSGDVVDRAGATAAGRTPGAGPPARPPSAGTNGAGRRARRRRGARRVQRVRRGDRPRALPGAGGGDLRTARRQPRDPQHADRFGEVARRHRRPLRGTRRGQAQRLHRADQGAGQREVLRPLPRLRLRSRRDDHRRRGRQPRRTDHLLHRRDPRQLGVARRSRNARRRRHRRRVPLLRRPATRLGVAGAAARTARTPSSC